MDSVLTPAEGKKIDELAKDPAIAKNIEADIQLGNRMQVNSTPTMVITHNGKPSPVVGVVSYQVLSKYLNSLLGSGK